jgi:hypothetical protein
MNWKQSDVRALARENCTNCGGSGRADATKTGAPCRCVLGAVFQRCLQQYRERAL